MLHKMGPNPPKTTHQKVGSTPNQGYHLWMAYSHGQMNLGNGQDNKFQTSNQFKIYILFKPKLQVSVT